MDERHIRVRGAVQGVGFRPFVLRLARDLQLHGTVCNHSAGVDIALQGDNWQLDQFVERLQREAPPLAHILSVEQVCQSPTQALPNGMTITASRAAATDRTLILPDVATCPDCLAELCEPTDRRYRYPFLNCTNCGPRYSIIRDLPYDRPLTTMVDFEMCADCSAEYRTPADRRFHAQPTACPRCGPQLTMTIAAIAAALQAGEVLAIKGIGGFHLACLASHDAAVARLRQLKRRPRKPLALMVRDVAMARQVGVVNSAESTTLQSAAAPIVLLEQHSPLPTIAPYNSRIGVMLPYAPLHHLLLQAVGAPLVMTSGNQKGAPLWVEEQEIDLDVDGAVGHDRPIANRCDDSVVIVTPDGVAQAVRRSRGYAPLPILLPQRITQPVLATGADLKNVSALAVDDLAFLTPHIGTLDHPATRQFQQETVATFARLFHIAPKVVVCDAHPNYASSRFAKKYATEHALPLIEVQHHHAHIAACMADNGRQERVIGLAFDGTGYGSDGHIWGGEVLLADCAAFERPFHLQYLPLPGGDAATKQPARIAYSYLRTLLVDEPPTLLGLAQSERMLLDKMLNKQINTPLTSSMGRLFDAVAGLLGVCESVTFEAEAAIALEWLAGQSCAAGHYQFALQNGQILLAGLFRDVVAELLWGVDSADIAHRFHRTIAEIALQTSCAVRAQSGVSTVALSGGVWQNQLLLTMTLPLLREHEFEVLQHQHVPPNDGGLALGQVAIATAKETLTPALCVREKGAGARVLRTKPCA